MAEAAGTVAQIWRYPVSSLRGEELASATLDTRGIAGDRGWGLADLRSDAVADPLRRPWRNAPDAAARTGSEGLEVRVPGEGWVAADRPEAEAALTRHFGFPVGLRRHVPFGSEAGSGTVAPRYALSHLHLLTTASMKALGALLPPGSIVDARRFRPNIVVKTGPGLSGFVETAWVGREMRIGRALVRVKEPCARCAFTALAQDDLPFDRAILGAIAEHGGGGFGVYCTILEPEPVLTGDSVELL